MGAGTSTQPLGPAERVLQQLRVLEQMFASGGPASLRKPSHPARVWYERLQRASLEGVPRLAEDHDFWATYLSYEIAHELWFRAVPSGDFWGFVHDPAVRKHLSTSVKSVEQYDNTLAELFICGFLNHIGMPASFVPAPGHPDFVIHGLALVRAEVKAADRGSSPRTVAGLLKKANDQLRGPTGKDAGVLFLGLVRAPGRIALGMGLPNDIAVHVDDIVHRQLHAKKFRSLARVVVYWDDIHVTGDDAASELSILRRSVTLDHPAPRKAVLPGVDIGVFVHLGLSFNQDWRWGEWIANLIATDPAAQTPTSPLFESMRALPNRVSELEAREALADPSCYHEEEIGRQLVCIAVRRVGELLEPNRAEPHLLIVFATKFAEPSVPERIEYAFRLFDDEWKYDEAVAGDALAVVETFFRRFGRPVFPDGEAAWIRRERVTFEKFEAMSAKLNTEIGVVGHIRTGPAWMISRELGWAWRMSGPDYEESMLQHRLTP